MTNKEQNIEILSLIKALNTRSKKADIMAVINNDLKKLSVDTNVSEEENSIKRFLKFKDATKQSFDPATTNSATELLKALLAIKLEISEDEISVDNKGVLSFEEDGKKVYLESNTMNQFWNVYKSSIMNLLENYKMECRNAKIDTSKPLLKQLNKFIDNFDAFDLVAVDRNLAFQLDSLATLTHSPFNMVCVPKGFSKGRTPKTNDFWDLSLLLLNKEEFKEKDSNYIWYNNNLDKMILEDCYKDEIVDIENIKLLFDNHDFVSENMLPKTIEDLTNCVSEMNIRIILRGLRILPLLNPKIKKVCDKMIADLVN